MILQKEHFRLQPLIQNIGKLKIIALFNTQRTYNVYWSSLNPTSLEGENMPPTTVLQKDFYLDLKMRKSVEGHLTSPTHGHCMVEV